MYSMRVISILYAQLSPVGNDRVPVDPAPLWHSLPRRWIQITASICHASLYDTDQRHLIQLRHPVQDACESTHSLCKVMKLFPCEAETDIVAEPLRKQLIPSHLEKIARR